MADEQKPELKPVSLKLQIEVGFRTSVPQDVLQALVHANKGDRLPSDFQSRMHRLPWTELLFGGDGAKFSILSAYEVLPDGSLDFTPELMKG